MFTLLIVESVVYNDDFCFFSTDLQGNNDYEYALILCWWLWHSYAHCLIFFTYRPYNHTICRRYMTYIKLYIIKVHYRLTSFQWDIKKTILDNNGLSFSHIVHTHPFLHHWQIPSFTQIINTQNVASYHINKALQHHHLHRQHQHRYVILPKKSETSECVCSLCKIMCK